MKRARHLVLAAVAVLALFALTPDSHVKAEEESVVGAWFNTVLVNTPSGAVPLTTELLTINRGGTFIDTLSIAHSSQNPSFTGTPLAVDFSDAVGSWKPTGELNQFAFTFKRFLFAGVTVPSVYGLGPFFPGENIGMATVEAVGTLQTSAGGQILAGPFTFQLTNLQGTVVLAANGTFSATRLQIQALMP